MWVLNHVQHISLVCSETLIVYHLIWDKGTVNEKYTRPKEMYEAMCVFLDVLRSRGLNRRVWLLDARFSSATKLNNLHTYLIACRLEILPSAARK